MLFITLSYDCKIQSAVFTASIHLTYWDRSCTFNLGWKCGPMLLQTYRFHFAGETKNNILEHASQTCGASKSQGPFLWKKQNSLEHASQTCGASKKSGLNMPDMLGSPKILGVPRANISTPTARFQVLLKGLSNPWTWDGGRNISPEILWFSNILVNLVVNLVVNLS